MLDARAWTRAWTRLLATFALIVGLLAWASSTLAAPAIPPAPAAHVHDEANVLSPGVRESLARRLALYQDHGGHQIVVWIGETTGELPIEEFAVAAFERWKLGRPKLDDGLAVFVAAEDRAIRIEVGYGLEPTITDLVASRVIRTVMIPRIERGDWDGAIEQGVEALVDTIEGAPGSLPVDPQGERARDDRTADGFVPTSVMGWLKLAGMVVAAVAFLVLLITNPRLALTLLFFIGRGGGGGGREGGGFRGLGGRSGGGGATGHW